jgi:hypothetical protein
MSTGQSGVIACHSISTTRLEATPQQSPPFKAWPEIKEWLRYYLLPTIGVLYFPEAPPYSPEVPPHNYMEALEELIIQWFPQLEPYRSRLMPMVEEYYLSHFGSEYNRQNLLVACVNVVRFLIDEPVSDAWVTEMAKAFSPEDPFSVSHELGHSYSFELIRPAITEFKATWSGIDGLLQQAATGVPDSFWDKFNDLNRKLRTCLSNSLALEELRANIVALCNITPDLQITFINRIYGEESENGRNKDSKVFHSLQSLTGGRLVFALLLTLLVECLDPLNPVSQLEQVQNSLKAESAHTWSDERWSSWFDSWRRLDAWEIVTRLLDEAYEKKTIFVPNATLTGTPNGIVEVSCPETMRLPLFLESMRQQLTLPELVRTLTCPFKGKRRRCCGFGHYLQNIWAAIPNEYRRRLKPPSKVCLQYAPIGPL